MKAEWLAGWLTAVYDSSPDTPLICIQPHHCSLHYTPSPCGEWRYELWEIKIPVPAARHIIKQARLNKQTATEGEFLFFLHSPPHKMSARTSSPLKSLNTPQHTFTSSNLSFIFLSFCLTHTHIRTRNFFLGSTSSSHSDGYLSCIIRNADIWDCGEDTLTNP